MKEKVFGLKLNADFNYKDLMSIMALIICLCNYMSPASGQGPAFAN